MRANTFAGQVIAVLSRRVSAFELDSAEPQTFPGRLWALISRQRRAAPVSPSPASGSPVRVMEKSQAAANETVLPPVAIGQVADVLPLTTSDRDATPGQQTSEAGESLDFGAVRVLACELGRNGPVARIHVREHPVFAELERSLDRSRRDLDLVLDRILLFDLDLALAIDLARDCDFTSDLARALARDLVIDLSRALARDLTHNRDLGLPRARVGDLHRALCRDLSIDLDLDLVHNLVHDLETVVADLNGVLAELNGALHDFTTADLREVDLSRLQLDGLRWSSATQWPARWATRIALDSVEVAPAVFEVRGRDAYATSV
jgi:hypothetical protein